MLAETILPEDHADDRRAARVDRLTSFRTRMDPLADEAVRALAAYPVGRGRSMFNSALYEGIDAVRDAPEPLGSLFAQVGTLPLWVEWDELNLGGATTLRCGIFSILALLCYALPLAYASSQGNKPLAHSGRLVNYAHRRITETGRFILETCHRDGLRRWSGGFKLTLTGRIMHAHVRRTLLRSGTWHTDIWGAPINQVDMAGTTLLLSVMVLAALRRMGVHFRSMRRMP
jgi:hypothetical protein